MAWRHGADGGCGSAGQGEQHVLTGAAGGPVSLTRRWKSIGTEAVAREMREGLDPLIIKRSPLAVPVKKPKATWVQPIVDAEIEYSGFTDDRLLRAAVFKGLRDDLDAPKPARRLKPK